MKKIKLFLLAIFFINFIVLMAYSEYPDIFNIVKLEFIRYPQEIIIKKDFKIQDSNDANDDFKIFVYYIYEDQAVICKNLGGALSSFICGDLAYYDNKGQKLQKAEQHIKNEKKEWAKCGSNINNCIGIYSDFKGRFGIPELYDCPFADQAIYKTGLNLLNSYLLSKTDIGLAIEKKALRNIKIKIDEIIFDWELLSGEINNAYWKGKRRFYLKINKEINIKLKYE